MFNSFGGSFPGAPTGAGPAAPAAGAGGKGQRNNAALMQMQGAAGWVKLGTGLVSIQGGSLQVALPPPAGIVEPAAPVRTQYQSIYRHHPSLLGEDGGGLGAFTSVRTPKKSVTARTCIARNYLFFC